jgi:hypothetical protein
MICVERPIYRKDFCVLLWSNSGVDYRGSEQKSVKIKQIKNNHFEFAGKSFINV